MGKRDEQDSIIREKIMFEITNYFILHGYAPTIKEIGEAVGLNSSASVSHHLNILMKEGRLETDARSGSSRALRVRGMRVVFVEKETEEKKKVGRKKNAGKN